MVARRAGSGSLRPDAGVLTERTRTAGAGTGPTWLRTLATAGPWLRCLAGRCRESGSSRAGAHGPDGRLRRLAAALLVAIAASAFGAPALAQTFVPADWSLKPGGLATGEQFRLLFLSSTKRDATATEIATYNTFVQDLAAGGHTDIQTHSAGFRAVGCTADTDARDNTSTTGTGVAIYWLNGAKVADHYADFYDGS